MRPFPLSTCVECGRKMPAGQQQKCPDSAGGVCNWHLPRAASEVAEGLLDALMALRSFMWKEGYADQSPAMAKADVAIYNATDGAE